MAPSMSAIKISVKIPQGKEGVNLRSMNEHIWSNESILITDPTPQLKASCHQDEYTIQSRCHIHQVDHSGVFQAAKHVCQ